MELIPKVQTEPRKSRKSEKSLRSKVMLPPSGSSQKNIDAGVIAEEKSPGLIQIKPLELEVVQNDGKVGLSTS